MEYLIRAWEGTVTVRLRGSYIPRFLEGCVRAGAVPLQTEQVNGECRAIFTVADFAKLAPVARRTCTRIHILRRRGVFFRLRRLRGRWGLLAGTLALLLLLWGLTARVWLIQVEGCETVRPAQVLALLEDCGVKPGMRAIGYDPDSLRNRILPQLHEIGWFSVRRYGCRIVVQVYERTVAESAANGEVCDIVASRGGTVTQIRATGGTAQVQKGTVVEPGQVLIAGYLNRTEQADGSQTPIASPAEGSVLAKVWDNLTLVTPVSAAEKHLTGKTGTRWSLRVGTWQCSFGKSAPQNASVTRETHSLSLGENLPLPMTLIRENWAEYERAVHEIADDTLSEALRQACTLLLPTRYEKCRPTILSADCNTENGLCRCTAVIQSVQEIGVPIPAAAVSGSGVSDLSVKSDSNRGCLPN